jgi:uncharacterized membrane protein YhaH (DUF805 family)
MHWMLMPYRRYAEFSGRSRRMEYWMFTLFCMIVYVVAAVLIMAGGGADFLMASMAGVQADPASQSLEGLSVGPLFWVGLIGLLLLALASFIPSLAVTVRRLHDRDMSGWYLLGLIVAVIVLGLIPGVGTLLTLLLEIGWIVLLALPGTAGPNKYGADPLGRAGDETFA